MVAGRAARVIAGCALFGVVGCGGGGSPDPVEQGPVIIQIQNQLQQARYLDWTSPVLGRFGCERAQGDGWESCHLAPWMCLLSCDHASQGQDCCVDCAEPMPEVRVIEPGGALEIRWEGKLVEEDTQHCSACSCYRQVSPPEGAYRVSVCVSDQVECYGGQCPAPDEYGVIQMAYRTGNPTCHAVEFTIPYGEDGLTISID